MGVASRSRYTVLESGRGLGAGHSHRQHGRRDRVTWTTNTGTHAAAARNFGTNAIGAGTGTLACPREMRRQPITVGVGGVMPVINDAAIEATEDFTITLSLPTGGAAIGAQNTTTVSITDEESTFNFDTAAVSHPENGVSTLTVTRTGATLTSANVTYTTSDGTARGHRLRHAGSCCSPRVASSYA